MKVFHSREQISHKIQRYAPVVVLILVWMITHYLIWRKNGIIDFSDSAFYLNYFDEVNQYDLTDLPREIHYAGYGLFVKLIMLTGLGREAVILAQVMLSALGAVLCYTITLQLSGSRGVSFFATLLFITWYKLRIWDYFILTESLFITGSLITFHLMVHRRHPGYVLLAALLTFTVRPAGIVLLAGTAAWFLVRYGHWLRAGKAFVPAAAAFVLLLLLGLSTMLRQYQLVETWSSGKIVYNVDNYPDSAIRDRLTIPPPDNLNVPDPGLPPLVRAAAFAGAHPAYFARLTLTKFYYFVTDTRPYYSLRHNLFSFFFLTGLWFLALRALLRSSDRAASVFTAVYLGGTILMASLTILSWEGRFFAPLYPFLFICAAIGTSRIDYGFRS